MNVASGGTDEEEDLTGGLQGHLADGHVPVIGYGTGGRELVAREGVEG